MIKNLVLKASPVARPEWDDAVCVVQDGEDQEKVLTAEEAAALAEQEAARLAEEEKLRRQREEEEEERRLIQEAADLKQVGLPGTKEQYLRVI